MNYGYGNYQMNMPMYGNNIQTQQPVQQSLFVPQQAPIGQFKPIGLQGKTVDGLDVVKATDIPLNGSISYFPTTDGKAIFTKRLKEDGSSEIIMYTPSEIEEKETKEIKYITENELNDKISGLNSKEIKDIKDEIKQLKRGLEDVTDAIKEKKGK